MQNFQPLLAKLEINLCDIMLFRQALTHKSFSREHNERLEFLGDAILDLVVSETLFQKFPDKTEGELTLLRASLVKGESLAGIAREVDLGKYLLLSESEVKNSGADRTSILAGALEAVIGAIYLDQGYSSVTDFVLRLLAQRIEKIPEKGIEKDSKTRLQELLQAKKVQLPDYRVVETSGAQHQQEFTVECIVSEFNLASTGTGKSVKVAEQVAAKAMLATLE